MTYFNHDSLAWGDILKIAIPSLLVIIGWWISLRSQFRSNDRTIKNSTLLSAAREMRVAADQLSAKCLPFVTDTYVIGGILNDVNSGKKIPNSIGSGWTKSLSWDEFISGMSEHANDFGLAPQQALAAISRYEYLYDFDWRKFGNDVHLEAGEIVNETREIITRLVASIQGGRSMATKDAKKMQQLCQRAQELTLKIRKQLTQIEKTLVSNVINVKPQDRFKIGFVDSQDGYAK